MSFCTCCSSLMSSWDATLVKHFVTLLLLVYYGYLGVFLCISEFLSTILLIVFVRYYSMTAKTNGRCVSVVSFSGLSFMFPFAKFAIIVLFFDHQI